jgi:hypothetical protein
MGSFSIWHWFLFSLVALFLLGFDWRMTYDWYLINRFVGQVGFHRKRIWCFASRLAPRNTMVRKAHG